jgi:predicted transcriptional regulator
VREGLEQAMRGEFVPDDEMDAFWKKYGVLKSPAGPRLD